MAGGGQALRRPQTPSFGRLEARTTSRLVPRTSTQRPPGVFGSADSMERQITARNQGTPSYGVDQGPLTTPKYGVPLNSNELKYNVGMVNSAYHSNRLSKLTGQGTDIPNTVTGGTLGNQFSTAGLQKGMIVTWVPSNPDSAQPIVPGNSGASAVQVQGRFGFQFHYNPKEIQVTYAGQPDVDLGMQASGQEAFNLIGTAISQSTVTLTIPINRIADFSYYDPSTKLLKTGVSNKLYAPMMPSIEEQKKIYEYGTMYDVEYLLAALLGFRMDTKYRGLTADLGWVAGRPAEIILGKTLHYVGWMSGITVNHVQFDQRMVPTWSVLNLSFSRIPDYPGL